MKKIPFIAILVLSVMFCSFGVITGCKSTIKMPEGLNEKCQVTWALIIAFHESSKSDATKSAVALLLQESQRECFASIDQARLRETSMQCKKDVYGEGVADYSDLKKEKMFINCIKIKEGILHKNQ